ncbi:putative anti-anti-sigma regulatory factor [Magnetofaba australis IT-1]|uniref:Putative anti-anti-sigma regulatory factor n=2 Tax=Magnetofaba TaxID=1472292 RepID=A0A1Y2K9Q0_9PROT|nr:putative anti-anti-sigma regulatory factor [Magnetofaba australis IT-1]
MGANNQLLRYEFEQGRLKIILPKKFNFQYYGELQEIIRNEVRSCTECMVDLQETVFLDSSAIGILLILHQECNGKPLVLVASSEASKYLFSAGLDKMLKIEVS